MSGELTVDFVKERDTKNAVRFQEVVADDRERGIVGTLYVLKSDLAELGDPLQLQVKIKAGK